MRTIRVRFVWRDEYSEKEGRRIMISESERSVLQIRGVNDNCRMVSSLCTSGMESSILRSVLRDLGLEAYQFRILIFIKSLQSLTTRTVDCQSGLR